MKTKAQAFVAKGVEGWRAWLRENRENTLIDINTLPPQLAWLTRFGYAAVLALIAIFLVFELVGDLLPQLTFMVEGMTPDIDSEPGRISYAALAIFSLTMILGWGLLLTGASDCRRRVFIPIFAFYFVMLLFTSFWTGARGTEANSGLQLLDILLLMGVLVFGIGVALTRHFAFWSTYPLAEFVGWSGLTALHLALSWGSATSEAAIGEGFVVAIGILAVVALPFWFLLGVDGAAAINDYAYFATHRAQSLLSPRAFRWLVPFVVIAEVVLGLVLVGNENDNGLGLVLCAPILLIAIIGLVIARRWTMKAAAITFWCAVVALLIGIFYALAAQGSDVNEVILGSGNVLPPALIFTVLLLYDVMTFGTRAASTDGRIMPRSGRLLIYLGVVVLTAGFTIFIFNLKNPETGDPAGGYQGFANNASFIGFFFLGPLYLLRALWRSRNDLTAPAPAPGGIEAAAPVMDGGA